MWTRKHELPGRQIFEGGKLVSPKRFTVDFKQRLVAPHARRLSAGQKHRAAAHSYADVASAGRRILSCASPRVSHPLVKIRARSPPRSARNSSAPGAKAVFIQ